MPGGTCTNKKFTGSEGTDTHKEGGKRRVSSRLRRAG